MFLIKLSIIVLIINCEVTKFVSASKTGTICWLPDEIPIENHTALLNQPFHIHFNDVQISKSWCYDCYDQVVNFPTINASGIYFDNITDQMSTLWKCYIAEDNGSDHNTINKRWSCIETDTKRKHCRYLFNLHVKGAKPVELTVNKKQLLFTRANLPVPYDGETTYFFEKDEHVDVVCKNIFSTGTLQIKYIAGEFSYVNPRNVSDFSKYSVKLTSEYNNSVFECTYNEITPKFTEQYVYKIYFLLAPDSGKGMKANSLLIAIKHQDINKFIVIACSIGSGILILAVIGLILFKITNKNANGKNTTYEDPTVYDTPDFLPNADENIPAEPEAGYEVIYSAGTSENYYSKINYVACKQPDEIKPRESVVYDVPYVRMSVIKTKLNKK